MREINYFYSIIIKKILDSYPIVLKYINLREMVLRSTTVSLDTSVHESSALLYRSKSTENFSLTVYEILTLATVFVIFLLF